MKRFFGYLCLCGCVIGMLAPSAWAAGTFSWEIVATGEAGVVGLTNVKTCGGAGNTSCTIDSQCTNSPDGSFCQGATAVMLGPGDILKIEYFLEGWNPNFPADGPLVEAYACAPDLTTLTNGPGSSLLLAKIPCDNGSQCAEFETCNQRCGGEWVAIGGSSCTENADCAGNPDGETCDQACATCDDSIFVDADRFDWIYFNTQNVRGGNCFDLELGAAVVTDNQGDDPGLPVYLGTFFLQLSDDACGDFTVALDTVRTFAAASGGAAIFDTDETATLTITSSGACAGGACCDMAAGSCVDVLEVDCLDVWTAGTTCATLDPACVAPCFFEFSNPPGCEEGPGSVGIDAGKRRDHDSIIPKCNGLSGFCGWDSVDVTFNDACDVSVFVDSRKWALTQMPATGPDTTSIPLNGNLPVNGQTVTVLLSGPIDTAYWTCLSLLSDATERICLGYLPGDVNGDGRANMNDILAAIDVLTNVAPRPLYAIDVDRDGDGAAPDILEVVNVLNGAGFMLDPPDAAMQGWSDCPPQ